MLNVTQIPAPRVALIDERTGLLTREWYRFFYNLYTLTGGGSNAITLEELQLGPPNQPDFTEILKQVNNNISPEYQDQSGDFLATLDTAQLMSMMARFENAEAAIQGAYLQPVVQTGTIANYNLDGSPTAGGIAYGTGPALAVSAAGSSGQVLTSAAAGTPTWTTPTTGTVTSVAQSFTGGLISVSGSPITTSGTLALTVAGTSGGIPYFSSASTWASSAALAAGSLVLGGGAGVTPATTATGTGVVTALGVNTGTAGAFVVNGGALGTPSSGTVTNLTGTASININGTVGATTAATGAFTTLSSTGNTTLGDATTDTVTVNGYMGLGVTPSANVGILTRPSALTTATQIGVLGGVLANSSATTLVVGVYGEGRTAATAFTVSDIAALYANNVTKGAGSTITNQHGLYINNQSQGTNNYGITSLVSSGANKYNIYASGTAQNYFAGSVGIGAIANASAILDAQSTTKGVRMPNMTTVQKNAIASPAAGLMVFDTTLAKLCVYSGAAWETITSL